MKKRYAKKWNNNHIPSKKNPQEKKKEIKTRNTKHKTKL